MAEKNKTVRMVARISGSRDGKDWPNPGAEITLPEAEADQLLVNGMAVMPDGPETATLSGTTETATTPRGNQSLRQSAAQAKADADAQAAAKAQADADAAAAAQKKLDDQAAKSAADAAAEQKAAAEAEKKAAAKK